MYRYTLDLPVVGNTEVGVPVEQFTADILSEASKQFPRYVPSIVAALNPHIEKVKKDAIQDLNDFLDGTVLPEVQQQKQIIVADVEKMEEKAMKALVLLGLSIVGGVGVSVWYFNRR